MKIAIVGAGSIGCYLGGLLSAGGYPVRLIGRERMALELATFGLTLTNWQGDKKCIAPSQVRVETDFGGVNDADVVLVCVKSPATPDVADQLKGRVKSTALVISCQNGIRNTQVLRAVLPATTILPAMIPFNVAHLGRGHFHCGTEGNIGLERAGGREQAIVRALNASDLAVTVHDDLRPIQWGKLLMNLNNPVNALAGIPLIEELKNRGYRKVLAAAIEEALCVLKAEGIRPGRTGKVIPSLMPLILRQPNWLFDRVARAMLRMDPTAISSMQEDLLNGRPTEVDYLNGEIVALGQAHSIPTPVNSRIVELVHAAEQSGAGSPKLTPGILLKETGLNAGMR